MGCLYYPYEILLAGVQVGHSHQVDPGGWVVAPKNY